MIHETLPVNKGPGRRMPLRQAFEAIAQKEVGPFGNHPNPDGYLRSEAKPTPAQEQQRNEDVAHQTSST